MRTALAMYRAAPLAFILVALISTLPEEVLLVVSQITYGTSTGSLRGRLQEVIGLLPQLLLGPLAIAATVLIVMQMLNGRPPDAGAALERVGEHFWTLVAVIVITSIGIVLGFIAFVIPGIYLAVLWLFAPIVSVTEHLSVRASLRRSAALGKGRFWWILGSYLAIEITVTLAGLVLSNLFDIPLGAIDGDAGIIVRGIVSFIALTLVVPVANAGIALIYTDLRVVGRDSWPLPLRKGAVGGD